jgi:hypothetical protein
MNEFICQVLHNEYLKVTLVGIFMIFMIFMMKVMKFYLIFEYQIHCHCHLKVNFSIFQVLLKQIFTGFIV